MRVSSSHHPAGFTTDIEGFGAIALRPLDLAVDLDELAAWVRAPSARFWGQSHLGRAELQAKYTASLADAADALLIGVHLASGAKICMLQPYRVQQDELGRHLRCDAADWGCHLFMVPSGRAVHNMTYFAMIALQHYMFRSRQAARLIHQPDIDNGKVAARLRQSGCRPGKVVHLRERTVRVYDISAHQFAQREYSMHPPAAVAAHGHPVALGVHRFVGRLLRKLGRR
jgi:Acetyltransferase (GNAT) domain